jgi:L-2-hydroxyglutarate oxidase
MDADILVIGGGIVGLSTAMHLSKQYPGHAVTLVEKESTLAAHQTGHNSGVVHAGVYYAPGSLKARFCREGAAATREFCTQHGIPVIQCGKLIVATRDSELPRLRALFERCEAAGLHPQRLDAAELARTEPRITGRGAVRIAASGITDYPAIARAMATELRSRGGTILLGCQVTDIRELHDRVVVIAGERELQARHAVACAGLMADRLASRCGINVDFRIVPFRGEYFRLPESKNDIVQHLIYPVPDPALPFLGVHLTRMIGGYVTVGPNAVLALALEGYRWRNVNVGDLAKLAMFPGFWRLLAAHRRAGLVELRNSLFRSGYLALCRAYCPELTLGDLEPYPAGVRAQAVGTDGSMIHDFLIRSSRRTLHVCNAPSPAATAAIPIGQHLAAELGSILEVPGSQSIRTG